MFLGRCGLFEGGEVKGADVGTRVDAVPHGTEELHDRLGIVGVLSDELDAVLGDGLRELPGRVRHDHGTQDRLLALGEQCEPSEILRPQSQGKKSMSLSSTVSSEVSSTARPPSVQ